MSWGREEDWNYARRRRRRIVFRFKTCAIKAVIPILRAPISPLRLFIFLSPICVAGKLHSRNPATHFYKTSFFHCQATSFTLQFFTYIEFRQNTIHYIYTNVYTTYATNTLFTHFYQLIGSAVYQSTLYAKSGKIFINFVANYLWGLRWLAYGSASINQAFTVVPIYVLGFLAVSYFRPTTSNTLHFNYVSSRVVQMEGENCAATRCRSNYMPLMKCCTFGAELLHRVSFLLDQRKVWL